MGEFGCSYRVWTALGFKLTIFVTLHQIRPSFSEGSYMMYVCNKVVNFPLGSRKADHPSCRELPYHRRISLLIQKWAGYDYDHWNLSLFRYSKNVQLYFPFLWNRETRIETRISQPCSFILFFSSLCGIAGLCFEPPPPLTRLLCQFHFSGGSVEP